MGRTNAIIKSGGGVNKGFENLKYSKNEFQFSSSVDIPEDCEITLPFTQTRLYDLVASNPPIVNLTVNALGTITSMERFLRNGNSLETVTINFDTSAVTNMAFAATSSNIKAIYGTLDATSVTGSIGILGSNNYTLTYIRFAPNTISCNVSMHNAKALSSDSWTSLFTGLKTVTEARTITLPTQVIFTEEELDDITAKGWTIVRYN